MKTRILIIDDDFDMCTLLNRFLTRNGYEVMAAHSGAKGVEAFKQGGFDIVICDYRLGDKEGKDVLKEINAIDPRAIVLIITGYSDIKTAVEVIKLGAYDYITKPLVPDEILSVLNNASRDLAAGTNVSDDTKKTKQLDKTGGYLRGQSEQCIHLYNQVEMVAGTDYSVILYGESGTGKEVIAKTIHNLSKRKDKPFIAMDCGTLSNELAGSELFGHMKGAFTGALADKAGHFELAEGGTLFLDEVGNLSYEIQASLLRVVQERKFKRIGGNKELPIDIRIIVASNENLQEAYKKGKFREDLYHRFNEFSIDLPALRARKDDIPLFADFFLQKTVAELGKSIIGFDDEVMQVFINYSWPGNLRELRNVIRRSSLLATGPKISLRELPTEMTALAKLTESLKVEQPKFTDSSSNPAAINNNAVKKDIPLKDTAAKAEYDAILQILQEVNFNKSKAAELLNIDRKTLYNKIRNFEANMVQQTSTTTTT